MGVIEIAIGVSHRPWAQSLFGYVADHGGAVVRKRVLSDEDALEGDYDVLVVDDSSSVLTRRIVQELHHRGRRVLAVHAGGDYRAPETLRAVGADATIEDNASPERFVDVIAGLVPARTKEKAGNVDDAFARITRELGDDLPPTSGLPDDRDPSLGWVTVVLAVTGGCGATEIALELTRALERRGERAVLVDADEVAPSLAQRTGLPLVPNIRNAVDAIEQGVGSLRETLTPLPGDEPEVLCGLSNPGDWVHVRPGQVADVVSELARHCPQVVVNAGPRAEDVTAINGQARYGITRLMLSVADQVVLVGAPTPVGVARLLDWVVRFKAVDRSRPVHLALNRGPTGAFYRRELEREVYRSFIPTSLHVLPTDKRVEEAAWNGRLVAAGPFAKAVAVLADQLPEAARPEQGQRRPRRRFGQRGLEAREPRR
jgi:MinD-like ATPase involved in chromosome partitioning or flagellar assembly